MPTSTSRVLELLELLQSAGLRTVGELSTRLDVNERTVRRYVEQLRDLGIPVESVRGRNGGYRIAGGYRMPPLMLTSDESVAVVVALLRSSPAASSDTAIQTALSKIRRALPRDATRRLDALLITAVLDNDQAAVLLDADVLLTVADAVARRCPVAITYRSAGGTDTTRRTIHPYDLINHAGHWYTHALDLRSGQERTFRLDRIGTARALTGSFSSRPARLPGVADPVAQLTDRFARAERPWRVTLRIQADEARIRRHLPASVAVLERLSTPESGDAEWFRAEISAQRLDWIPGVIVAMGCEVAIDGPDELRREAMTAAARLASAAGQT